MRKWLQRSNEASSLGTYPGSRTLEEKLKNGIVIIDKPPGPTSHTVDAYVKEILGVSKASHSGTLDPRVSGVLVIALENATKLMPILLKSKKEYVALVALHKDVTEEEIRKVCKEFVGKIKQLPPLRSAVARRVREREIYYLEVLEIDGRSILFKVGCEAGTYIRRLADDIGKKLGGAHLQELRRTKTGCFTEEKVISLQKLVDLGEEAVQPMELILDGIGNVVVKDSAVDAICNGAPLSTVGIVKVTDDIEEGNWVGLVTLKGELIAIGKALMVSEDMVKKKGLAVKTDRVLMKRGAYPSWKEFKR